jgi:hypothetical protein
MCAAPIKPDFLQRHNLAGAPVARFVHHAVGAFTNAVPEAV